MIKKTSETRPLAGTVVNTYSESQTSAYSCDYMNWKLLVTNVEYSTATNLPNNYSELMIYIKLSTYDEIFSIHIIKDYFQTTTRKEILSGCEAYLVYADVNKTQILTAGISKNGTTQTSATYDVYYR